MIQIHRCAVCGDLATHSPDEVEAGTYLCDQHYVWEKALQA